MSKTVLREGTIEPIQDEIWGTSRKGRFFKQIGKTITFDARRNLKKLVSMTLINTLFVVLFLIISILQDSPQIDDATKYAQSYLFMINFLVIITAMLFGGSIIVEDFEKQTGNLIFPKIERTRLLVGRYVARLTLASISLAIYYAEIALLTFIYWGTIPAVMWESLGWAILYLHLVLSFVVLMSAALNRIATANVATMLFLFIGFNIISSLLMVSQSDIEPLFVLTYYSNIISAWFDMPISRYKLQPRMGVQGGGGDGVMFYNWQTPSAEGALIGIAIYSTVLLVSAWLIYRRKQAKT